MCIGLARECADLLQPGLDVEVMVDLLDGVAFVARPERRADRGSTTDAGTVPPGVSRGPVCVPSQRISSAATSWPPAALVTVPATSLKASLPTPCSRDGLRVGVRHTSPPPVPFPSTVPRTRARPESPEPVPVRLVEGIYEMGGPSKLGCWCRHLALLTDEHGDDATLMPRGLGDQRYRGNVQRGSSVLKLRLALIAAACLLVAVGGVGMAAHGKHGNAACERSTLRRVKRVPAWPRSWRALQLWQAARTDVVVNGWFAAVAGGFAWRSPSLSRRRSAAIRQDHPDGERADGHGGEAESGELRRPMRSARNARASRTVPAGWRAVITATMAGSPSRTASRKAKLASESSAPAPAEAGRLGRVSPRRTRSAKAAARTTAGRRRGRPAAGRCRCRSAPGRGGRAAARWPRPAPKAGRAP